MKQKISRFAMVLVGLCLLFSAAEASTVRGKIFYSKNLKQPCGYNGELMGKKHTVNEWRTFYNENKIAGIVKAFCPKSELITEEKDLTNLYHFLSSFASDSGNVPSCN